MRLPAVCALMGFALAGCVTTSQGDKMSADIAQLRERLDKLDEKVVQLHTVLDESTALLGRNSADLVAKMAKNETDIAAITGKI